MSKPVILIVDDEPDVLNAVEDDLRTHYHNGYRIVKAASGREALEALEQLKARKVHVVLFVVDQRMPHMSGTEFLAQAMKLYPEAPKVLLTAYADSETAITGINSVGLDQYLMKPWDDSVHLTGRLNATLERKKLRDLERAYLQQEMMLRQSEKLATLGKLSAGIAHELNNPAAAAQRCAARLQAVFPQLQNMYLRLSKTNLSAAQRESLLALEKQIEESSLHPVELDSFTRSEREEDLENWLGNHGVENPWEFASALVNLGYDLRQLTTLSAEFSGEQFPAVISVLCCTYMVHSQLASIRHGAYRITEIVKALKLFTYMDQAPIQSVNVHEGLDSTLALLRSKFKQGITVQREYAENLPRIQAYGSELNQVWTNIIDNAIYALGGEGEIIVRTRQSDALFITVEIEDNGPGIPEAIQSKIFDPFFTTKPLGEGTGLGLNISHNIIVQKHKGKLSVDSQPGRTRFVIVLPINFEASEEEAIR